MATVVVAIAVGSEGLLELDRLNESGVEGVGGGGDFVAAAIGFPGGGVALGVLVNAVPADEGGVDPIAHRWVDVETTDSLRAAPPFVAGEGVEVDVEGLEVDREVADRLGGVDEGEAGLGWVEGCWIALICGVAELAATEGSDVGEGQDLPVVPEDVAEDDEAGGGAELGC